MKSDRRDDPDISEEYDFSKGQRGVYFDRARQGIRFVPSPDESKGGRPPGAKSRRATKDRVNEPRP